MLANGLPVPPSLPAWLPTVRDRVSCSKCDSQEEESFELTRGGGGGGRGDGNEISIAARPARWITRAPPRYRWMEPERGRENFSLPLAPAARGGGGGGRRQRAAAATGSCLENIWPTNLRDWQHKECDALQISKRLHSGGGVDSVFVVMCRSQNSRSASR